MGKTQLSAEQLEKIMVDGGYLVGYCRNHEMSVDQDIFEFKGCWTCYNYFHFKNWPYISAEEAAKENGVSVGTVYRWIKQGKLKARLLEMGRINTNVPEKFYAVLPRPPFKNEKVLKRKSI